MYRISVVPHIFFRIPVAPAHFSLGFQLPHRFFIRIPAVAVVAVVVAIRESQPAVQAARRPSRELWAASCAAASRLCRHSADAHPARLQGALCTLKMRLCCLVFRISVVPHEFLAQGSAVGMWISLGFRLYRTNFGPRARRLGCGFH